MITTNQQINTILESDTKTLKARLLGILAKQSYIEGKIISLKVFVP